MSNDGILLNNLRSLRTLTSLSDNPNGMLEIIDSMEKLVKLVQEHSIYLLKNTIDGGVKLSKLDDAGKDEVISILNSKSEEIKNLVDQSVSCFDKVKSEYSQNGINNKDELLLDKIKAELSEIILLSVIIANASDDLSTSLAELKSQMNLTRNKPE